MNLPTLWQTSEILSSNLEEQNKYLGKMKSQGYVTVRQGLVTKQGVFYAKYVMARFGAVRNETLRKQEPNGKGK